MVVPAVSSAIHNRPFPTLSLFSIYSSTPLLPNPPVTPAADGGDDEQHQPDDATLEASKLLLFFSQDEADEPLTKERKARLMGTVMGMADFARSVSTAFEKAS